MNSEQPLVNSKEEFLSEDQVKIVRIYLSKLAELKENPYLFSEGEIKRLKSNYNIIQI